MALTVQVEGYDQLLVDIEKAGTGAKTLMRAAITNSVNRIQAEARALAPHRTGTLQRSILTQINYPTGQVSVDAKYGQFIEQGTGIYGPSGSPIVPKTAKVLAWKGAAGMVFARSVKGMRAKPFFKPGVERSATYISDQFTNVLDKLTQALGGNS